MIKLEHQTELIMWVVLVLLIIMVVYLVIRYLDQKDKHQSDLFDLHNKYANELQSAKKDLKEIQFQAGILSNHNRVLKATLNAYKPVKVTDKPADCCLVIRENDTVLLQVDDVYRKPTKLIEIEFKGIENLYYFVNLYRELGLNVEVFDAVNKKTIIDDSEEKGQC